jgi:hypothetical protein
LKITKPDNAVSQIGQNTLSQSFWNEITRPSRKHMFTHRSEESKSSIRNPLWFHLHQLYSQFPTHHI